MLVSAYPVCLYVLNDAHMQAVLPMGVPGTLLVGSAWNCCVRSEAKSCADVKLYIVQMKHEMASDDAKLASRPTARCTPLDRGCTRSRRSSNKQSIKRATRCFS